MELKRSPGLPWVFRYARVGAGVAFAALLRVPLHPVLGARAAFVTFFPAVVYGAWSAGWGGGLLATALSAVISAFFILSPASAPLRAAPADLFSLLVFVLVGVTISFLGQDQHRARREAEASAQMAERNASVMRESEARKGAMLEAALDCIITIDEQGKVIEWNPAAERTFGYAHGQALGETLATLIIPQSLRGAHSGGIAHYLATGEGPVLSRRIEVPALHADGREFPVELTVVPIHLDGRSLFTAYLRDLTEREQSAAQQRTFLRDVLLSVTEGRLRLCHAPSDLPTTLPAQCGPIPLSGTDGIRELRHQAGQVAAAYGFGEERRYDLVTATGEAAMNAAVHAGGGLSRVCGGGDTIQVWVEDQGKGIDVAHLPRATLEKGYTTAGTLGHGMKMMLQTADRVWLLTGGTGTTVVLEMDRVAPPVW